MIKIQIILGSTREGRQGEKVARWIFELAKTRKDFEVELIDLLDWTMPFLNNPKPPITGEYDAETKKWARKISEGDGYVIVTPEYNHGYPAVLKNALDYLYEEWNNKPVAFVSYGGSAGGVRAVEQLRGVVIELRMVPIRDEINIPFIRSAFDEQGNPLDEGMNKRAENVLGELLKWSTSLKLAPL